MGAAQSQTNPRPVPVPAVVCATIDRFIRARAATSDRIGADLGAGVYAEELEHLYGTTRRAAAQLRALVRMGLVRPVDMGVRSRGYALTLEGFQLAVAAHPSCCRCGCSIDVPAPEVRCRDCLIIQYERSAALEEQMADFELAQAARHEAEAEKLRALAGALRDT